MNGVEIKKAVTTNEFKMIIDAEFVDLIIFTDSCSEKVRLYPVKTIDKYDL